MPNVETRQTIRLHCECGARFKVPHKYAGRRIRCSGCGEKLRVETRDEPRPRSERKPAPAPRQDDPLPAGHHARHVKAIAFWCQALGLLLGGIGLVILLLAVAADGSYAVMKAALTQIALSTGVFALGQGLWRNHGWARYLTIGACLLGMSALVLFLVIASPSKLVIAIGLGCGGAILAVLLDERGKLLFNTEHRARTAGSRRPKFWLSPFFVAPVLLVAALFLSRFHPPRPAGLVVIAPAPASCD